MAIKTEQQQVGVRGSGALPGGSFGGGDVGSGLMRAGLSLMRKSQANNQANEAMANRLRGEQEGYAAGRMALDADGNWTSPEAFNHNNDPDYNATYVQSYRNSRFGIFQDEVNKRLVDIQTGAGTAAEKMARMQDLGQTYMDKIGIDETERGRYGSWLDEQVRGRTTQVVAAENAQMEKLRVDGAQARIKRNTDELAAAVAGGNVKEVERLRSEIGSDMDVLEKMLAISPDARQSAQTQIYELARVTGMSRQIGTALSRMEVEPGKVDLLLDAIKNGSDYKLEWTGDDGRQWSIDTKTLDVADPQLRQQLITNLNGTVARTQKVWNDMAENEQFLERIKTGDPTIPLSGQEKTKFDDNIEQLLQMGGVDNPETWQKITHWSARTGSLAKPAADGLVRLALTGSPEQMATAARAWNDLRNARDERTGKDVGNSIAYDMPDEHRDLLDALADGIGMGMTGEQIAVFRDKAFAGDRNFADNQSDALRSLSLVRAANDEPDKSFDKMAVAVWNSGIKTGPGFWNAVKSSATLVLNPALNVEIGGGGGDVTRPMPGWWKDRLRKAYTYNYMLNPTDPQGAFDNAVRNMQERIKTGPVWQEGVSDFQGDYQNIESTFGETAANFVARGAGLKREDGYDQLEHFVLSEIGMPLDEQSVDFAVADMPVSFDHMRRMAEGGKPELGKNMSLRRIAGDNANPQFEVWYRDSGGSFPLRTAEGQPFLIQPASEWRYRQARVEFDKKMGGLTAGEERMKENAQSRRDEAFNKYVLEQLRLDPGKLPDEDQLAKFKEDAFEGFEQEKEGIEAGFEKLKQDLEETAPLREAIPAQTDNPIVEKVRRAVTGEEATTPYTDTGQPRINSPETGPWQESLKSYLVPGKDASHAQLEPALGKPLAELLDAAKAAGHDVKITSGYRSPDHQARIIASSMGKYGLGGSVGAWQADVKSMGAEAAGRKWRGRFRSAGLTRNIGMPGGSKHQHGTATDLNYAGAGLKSYKNMTAAQKAAHDFIHQNASAYGLNFRMGHEPWHIEPGKAVASRQAPPPVAKTSSDVYAALVTPRTSGADVVWTAARAIDGVLPDGTGGHFLVNTASTESNFGKARGTFRLKGDRGIWQINAGGAFAEVQRQLGLDGKVAKAAAKLKETFGLDVASATHADMDQPLMGAAYARLYMIARGKETLPNDVQSQAAIWKKYYNTVLGAGKVTDFVSKAVSAPQAESVYDQSVLKAGVDALSNWWNNVEADTGERLPPIDPNRLSMTRKLPDLKALENLQGITRAVVFKDDGTYRDPEVYKEIMHQFTDLLGEGMALTGDQKLMLTDMLEFARDNPLLHASISKNAGKRILFYDHVVKGPGSQTMKVNPVTWAGDEAVGYNDTVGEFMVVPMPQGTGADASVTGYRDAMTTLAHEFMHSAFTNVHRNDQLTLAQRDRLGNEDYQHAMIYAIMSDYKSSSAEKRAQSKHRAEVHLEAFNNKQRLRRNMTLDDLIADSKILAGAIQ